jgi:uncharacterized ion transporter superfamily protein YfcC
MPKSRFPHPLTLLTGCVLLAAGLSYVLPAGEYDRRDDPVTGRTVVVAGTFHEVEPSPVSIFQAMVDIPKGMLEAGDIIFLVFLIGGAFTVVDQTGTLRRSVSWLVARLHGRSVLVIPIVAVLFATAGALENMKEEIIALIPVLLILTRRLGFTPLVAVAMSAGAAFVGSSFSPINPFQVGIAQKLAELPPLSGGMYRLGFLVLALGIWIWGTMRYAERTRRAPEEAELDDSQTVGGRGGIILGVVLATFAILVYGLLELGWHFDHMSGLFFIMGVVVGLIGGLKVTGTAEAYMKGFTAMAYPALLIGFARAIFVVLQDGRILDTILHGMFTPIAGLPLVASAIGMVGAHALVHVPVPSVSGQAVLTMPVLVPLSDLLGMSRQVTVLAYQYGAGLCDILTPTSGALLALLAAGKVRYNEWFKFAFPLYLVLMLLGALSVVVAIAIGLQ